METVNGCSNQNNALKINGDQVVNKQSIKKKAHSSLENQFQTSFRRNFERQ